MALTLWRGSDLLGALITRADSADDRLAKRSRPPSFSAFLIPAHDKPELQGVTQMAFSPKFGVGVQQHATEPHFISASTHHAAKTVTNPGPVTLEPMSPDAIKGVPPDLQLTVRTEDGAVYLPGQLLLQEIRYDPTLFEIALREVPGAALIDGSVWLAFLGFDSETESPLHNVASAEQVTSDFIRR